MHNLHLQAMHIATTAKEAATAIATASVGTKNAVLDILLDLLRRRAGSIFSANQKDVAAAEKSGMAPAMLDRLLITRHRLDEMINGVRQIAVLPDPVGQVIDGWARPNGLRVSRIRVPIGVLMIIYESRPNVTIDAAALAIKSGNAAILRGGKESLNTNIALGKLLGEALRLFGLPTETVQVLTTPDRDLLRELLQLSAYIDVVIPRGGKELIQALNETSRIPMLKHLDGVCHLYVDCAADLAIANELVLNAKTQRPGTCNAVETLLVHQEIAEQFLPECLTKLAAKGVNFFADHPTMRIAETIAPKRRKLKIAPATPESWRTEYLDLTLNVATVKSLSAAIQHINNYGSHHTDAIVSGDVSATEKFQHEVDSAAVMVNCSTRFNDGFELGLGAEIGISTDKLHARGPVGLVELTTYKWLVNGNGQTRG